MLVIYQIHDFCANNFHYHNAVDDDYRWCSHYRTLATACEEAAATVDRNWRADLLRTGGDCNAMSLRSHWSCFDGDSVDGLAAAAAAAAAVVAVAAAVD
jgi:hypothetical protein